MKATDIVASVLAVLIGAFAANVDIHNNEVQAAVIVLLVGGGILGTLSPRFAWVWALILGLSIFVGDYIGEALGLSTLYPTPTWNFGALIAFVPALIGTYSGAGLRAMFGPRVVARNH